MQSTVAVDVTNKNWAAFVILTVSNAVILCMFQYHALKM